VYNSSRICTMVCSSIASTRVGGLQDGTLDLLKTFSWLERYTKLPMNVAGGSDTLFRHFLTQKIPDSDIDPTLPSAEDDPHHTLLALINFVLENMKVLLEKNESDDCSR